VPRAVVATIAVLLAVGPARVEACSVLELRGTPGYRYRPARIAVFVDSATVIVRAVALGPDTTQHDATVEFSVVEVLRGAPAPRVVRLPGEMVTDDDYNPQPGVPYTMVRRAGQRGACYAREYRAGAEYLLLLRPEPPGALTASWKALAPLNEQVRGAADPWVAWVRARVSGARGRDT